MPTPPTNSPPHNHLDPEPGPREPDTGRTFTQKFGIFMTGVAIGLMFLAWTQYRKGAAAGKIRAKQEIQQREAAEALPGSTTEPGKANAAADEQPDTEPTADPD